MIRQTSFAISITKFLAEYLPSQKNASKHTIRSYRDVIKQFLYFMNETYALSPEKIEFSNISKDVIVEFLTWLEIEKAVSINTRNQRLAALHSFFRYAQNENPEILGISQRILGIPLKRCHQKIIEHLETSCIEKLLIEPERDKIKGLRDCTLLSVLYDAGLRVQELIDLKVSDIRLINPAIMNVHGKGDKSRIVPITANTKKLLEIYMIQNNLKHDSRKSFPLFFNSRYEKFTRPGIAYIIKKYYRRAKQKYQNLPWKEAISPHTLRHSKAVHMLDAGVPLIYIRDFLGHVNITTTEIYLRSDRKVKREALEKIYIEVETEDIPSWIENKSLISWLNDICK